MVGHSAKKLLKSHGNCQKRGRLRFGEKAGVNKISEVPGPKKAIARRHQNQFGRSTEHTGKN